MIASEIKLHTAAVEQVTINKKEALRYMGIVSKESNVDFEALYDECLALFNSVVNYRAVIAPISISCLCDDNLSLCFCNVKSFHLSRNLQGMTEGYVFAATVGTAVDRLIMKYSRLEPSKAIVIDAIASAAVEGFCNKINDEYTRDKFFRFRFSPGYGDLPLEIQPKILEYLDAYRKLGISLSDNLFMSPTKSVTAIFGVSDNNEHN